MDDELRQIREKKMEELKKRISSPGYKEEVSSGGIKILDQTNYSQIIQQNPLLVIDFWAPWCGPCKTIAPVIDDLAMAFSGKVTFAKCNTDENQQLANQLGISAIPTLFFYRHGQIVDKVSGVVMRAQLAQHIRALFQLP
ncbi:MAG TPA: thioredoxin [Methanospirillum sp.]|nr:thioredoxin [Methanospirillum sp.]